jgi:hypothetical protein
MKAQTASLDRTLTARPARNAQRAPTMICTVATGQIAASHAPSIAASFAPGLTITRVLPTSTSASRTIATHAQVKPTRAERWRTTRKTNPERPDGNSCFPEWAHLPRHLAPQQLTRHLAPHQLTRHLALQQLPRPIHPRTRRTPLPRQLAPQLFLRQQRRPIHPQTP